MKTITTMVAALATVVVSTGVVAAQEWGGVAGIVAAQGYSASSGLTMMVRPHQDPPVVATDIDEAQPAPPPRIERHRKAGTALAGDVTRGHHAAMARLTVPRAAMLAKAKRIGIRRRPRLA